MSSIGSWNKLVFKVSSKKVFSLTDISVKYSANWVNHEIIGQAPKTEFQGKGQIAVECKIILDAALGVRPENEAKKFVNALQNGTKAKLVIAGKAMSKYQFALTDVSKAYDIVTNQGKTQRLTLNLTFKESR